MGCDASLFALKARRWFYYDRDYNLMSVDPVEAVAPVLERLCDHKPVTAHEVRAVLVAHDGLAERSDGTVERLCHHLGWRLAILRFVDAFPDDLFVRHTDSAEPSWHDIAEQGGFLEWAG